MVDAMNSAPDHFWLRSLRRGAAMSVGGVERVFDFFWRNPSVMWRLELIGDRARQSNPSPHVSLSIQMVHVHELVLMRKKFESQS